MRAPDACMEAAEQTFYTNALCILREADAPFLVGGGYAFTEYTGVVRWTKDLDIFVRREECDQVLDVLARAGYRTELTFPHWLAKAFCDDYLIDVIFSSGNGAVPVDDEWFEHAIDAEILGEPIKMIPAEEMVWSKAFIMERERYDGADIAHILRSRGKLLDWPRLVRRFGPNWRVLLSHLILYGFIYPTERAQVPRAVVDELVARLQRDPHEPVGEQICHGTLLSLQQYRTDIECWGYRDARLLPIGNMTAEDVAFWTAAFDRDEK